MKRLSAVLAVVLLLVVLALPVLASDITGARYVSTVRVTNAGASAASSVSTNMTLNTTTLVSNGFADDTSDFAIRIGTTDTAFMPGYGTNPWAIFVPLVGGSSSDNYSFYSGNVTGGKIRYFPGSGGMTTADDNTFFEPGSNFAITQKGYVDTTAGSNKNLVNKPNAVSVYVDPTTTGKVNATIGQNPASLAQVIYGGSDDAIAATTTEYNVLMGGGIDANWNATESVNYQVMPTAGAITQLYVRLSANVGAGTATFTLMKNGVAQSLSVVINAGASTGSDLTNSVSFVASDTVSLRYVTSGASGTPYAQWSTLWTSTTANESILLLNATAVIANTVYFLPQGNGGAGMADETYAYAPMPTAGTFKKLYVQLSADPGAAPDNYRFYLRKGGVDTALTVNIIADATTGNNTANTVAVVADDLISISVVPENTPAVAPYAAISMVFSPTVTGESVVMGGGIDGSPATGATNYGFLSGGNKGAAAWSATEATQNQLTQLTVISKLYVKLRTAPQNGAGVQSYTISVREAVGNTGLTVTVSEDATTGNNIVNTYTSANGAVTDIMSVPANTPVATYIRWGLVSRYLGVSVSVSGITPTAGEKTVTTRANLNNPVWATGNVLHFDGTATSYVDAGAIYNADVKWWISFWFKLDANWTVGGGDQALFNKTQDANNFIVGYLRSPSGTLSVYLRTGAVDRYLVSSTQTSWVGGTYYHVIFSTSNVNEADLQINGGTPVHAGGASFTMPGGGNLLLGGSGVNGLIGVLTNVIIGTADLTGPQRSALYSGTAPGTETDYWYIDEGTGNTVYSYGSAPNNGIKGAATAWQTSTYTAGKTGRLSDFTLQVDSLRAGHNIHNAAGAVPNNANNWTFLQNNVMPYMEYQEITIAGAQEQYIDWEYGATFNDTGTAGHDHDATPTFLADSSDSNVTAALISLSPVTEAKVETIVLITEADILTGTPSSIPELYTELDFTHIPGADAANALLTAGDVPQALWWFPFLFLGIAIIGLIVYGATAARLFQGQIVQGAGQGSLLAMCIVIEALLVVFGIMNPLPLWPAILFPIAAAAIISSTKHTTIG